MTLPSRTLGQLQALDEDRAKAIVKAVDAVTEVAPGEGHRVQIVEMAPGVGLLVVPPIRGLRSIPWLRLIEVAPARCLMTIAPGTPIEKVEIALLDLVAGDEQLSTEETEVLESLIRELANLRRGQRIAKAELLVVARAAAHQAS